jgi:hypothetical protein
VQRVSHTAPALRIDAQGRPLRIIPAVIALLLLAFPTVATGQTFVLHGSGGPTVPDAGYSLAAGMGFSATSRVTVLINVERTHLSTRVRTDGNVGSIFRGGTVTDAAVEVRASLLDRDRVGPYVFAGAAAGVSRPNVNDRFFRDRTTNTVLASFAGAGIQVPLEDRFTLVADVRMMIGTEAGELLALAPIRAGVAWHF